MDSKQRKNIGIVSLYFHPAPSATGRLLTDLAVGLEKKGYQVSAFTGRPLFWDVKSKVPKKEQYKGIDVTRVFSTQLDNRRKIGQLVNAVTFTFSVFFTLLFNREVKLFFIVTNPPFLPFIGPLLKKLKNLKKTHLGSRLSINSLLKLSCYSYLDMNGSMVTNLFHLKINGFINIIISLKSKRTPVGILRVS